jgi:hypothetical protein
MKKSYVIFAELGSLLFPLGLVIVAMYMKEYGAIWFAIPIFVFSLILIIYHDTQDHKRAWQKRVPDSEGFWLRINNFNEPQIHGVRKDAQGNLCVYWNMRWCEINGNKAQLEQYYWQKIRNMP